jgi:hypothetical protein
MITQRELQERGWTFFEHYASKDALGGMMVVEFDKNDRQKQIVQKVSAVEKQLEAAGKAMTLVETLKGTLS